jgi:hypothetical protein
MFSCFETKLRSIYTLHLLKYATHAFKGKKTIVDAAEWFWDQFKKQKQVPMNMTR